MAGNKQGAKKRRQNMIKKAGSVEAYLQQQRASAAKGGKWKGRKGFAVTGVPRNDLQD